MNIKRITATALAIALGSLMSACTSGNSAIEPTVRAADIINGSTLQFAVGTANVAGTPALNTVVTFRCSTASGCPGTAVGNSAVLLDTPSIVGPAGLTVPAVAAFRTDAGTNSLTAQLPQVQGVAGVAASTTFGFSGGVYGMGFAPANGSVTSGGTNGTANYPKTSGANFYTLPIGGAAPLAYIGGPPAFPQVRDGTYPSGYAGFLQGFTDFAVTPVAGTYALNVVVPTSAITNGTKSATATLTSTATLPTFAAPTIALDGLGGGTISVTVPVGVVEAYVEVVDTTGSCYGLAAPAYYTIKTTTTGPQTLTLPDTLGPSFAATSTAFTKTICSGDKYQLYAVGFDYNAFEASYPGNTSPTPTIVGANGQADVTASAVTAGTSL